MRIFITGICGFVGSRLAESILERMTGVEIIGIDNLSRRGSESNVGRLTRLGCRVLHGDVRLPEDFAELPRVDWVLDCAALPTVLAGLEGGTAQLIGNNLIGTLHLLERCRRDGAGFIMMSTSRVYSIDALAALPLTPAGDRLSIASDRPLPPGFTAAGVAEAFSTAAPVSLYGATKLASEQMALEYGHAFRFPVRVNRCGVIAGPGQFGRIDQGIFSFWIYQWLRRKPLAYIGFGGGGWQVRDFLSPADLAELVVKQLAEPARAAPPIVNVGGGLERSMSLRELSAFCAHEIGHELEVRSVPETRPYDVPYYVTNAALAEQHWDWRPTEPRQTTLQDIVRWGREHMDQLTSFG